jgi:gliding motility-associated-like protein
MKLFALLFMFWFCSSFLYAQEVAHSHAIHNTFVENKGQWDPQILFQTHFSGGNMWVQQHKILFHLQDFTALHETHAFGRAAKETDSLRQTVVHMNFVGSNDITQVEKAFPSTDYYNYYLGNDKARWASDVHGFGETVLKNVYNGIDLKLIQTEEELKYEYHLKPEVDPALIRVSWEGQDKVFTDQKGNLVVQTELGNILEKKPYAYQIINGRIRQIECAFKVDRNEVSFELGKYDNTVELVIDPVLIFATYSGSFTDNFGMTATYGHDGTAYSGGTIFGNNYPTPDTDAYDVSSSFTVENNADAITDVFISKYAADGKQMIWTSFIGGGGNTQGTETVHSLMCDSVNNVYFFGATSSSDFPIQNGYQNAHAGGSDLNIAKNGTNFGKDGTDIFVAKLSSNGHDLMGSTYFGGSGNDGVNYTVSGGNYILSSNYDSLTTNYGDQYRGEIMLDGNGNCIIASCTRSTDFPFLNSIQDTLTGMQDGVVFKLNSDLSTLLWSTYIGGSNNDACYSVKIDQNEDVVCSGGTSSTDFPVGLGGWKDIYQGGKTDGFVVRISKDGLTLLNGSFIGTVHYDQAFFVELDTDSNLYVLGQSSGGDFPVTNAGFENPGSGQFILKLDPTMSTNLNSTVFGNGKPDPAISPTAFLVDVCGNIYVSGWGASILQGSPLSGMPVTSKALYDTPPNGFDFYLMVMNRDFDQLVYATYIGGNISEEHVDGGTSRFDKKGVVYQSVCAGCAVCQGCGGNSDFPTTPGAHSQINKSYNCNNVLFKFDFQLVPNAEFKVADTTVCVGSEVEFDNFSSTGSDIMWVFDGDTSYLYNPTILFDTPGTYTIVVYSSNPFCSITDSMKITIHVQDNFTLNVPPDFSGCEFEQFQLWANSSGMASQYVWSTNANFTDTLNTNLSKDFLIVYPEEDMNYWVNASNAYCEQVNSVSVSFINSALKMTPSVNMCSQVETTVKAESTDPAINFQYLWSPDSIIVGPNNTTQISINPAETQYLYLSSDDGNGCVLSDSILVNVSYVDPSIIYASASDTMVTKGEIVSLYAVPNGYQYIWKPVVGLSNPNAQNPSAEVNQSGYYVVGVGDGICFQFDSVFVQVFDYLCDDSYIFVPNAFSPNNDGENDRLYVRSRVVKKVLFRVYNRLGELMFETNDMSVGWDGTYKGKQMDPDVYDYYVKVTCYDDYEAVIKGNVTLLR